MNLIINTITQTAYGYSNFELQSRAHIDTSVRIGTISQIFTAAQVLNHMRKNRICLDHTPYKQYVSYIIFFLFFIVYHIYKTLKLYQYLLKFF